MFMVNNAVVAFCCTAAVLLPLAATTPALAQPDCNVDQLPREASGQGRLAVRLDGDWQFFAPNDSAPAHVIEMGGLQYLCLAWEAPPFRQSDRQIVYTSTQYRDDQPLWLYRNSVAAAIPFVGRLFGTWGRRAAALGVDPGEAFSPSVT